MTYDRFLFKEERIKEKVNWSEAKGRKERSREQRRVEEKAQGDCREREEDMKGR